ncbi:MAG: hypothetical protein IJE40_02380, partial [Clostridia bacterium]|nr:hypothetical protein [Clostridia bacterium]
MSIDFTGIITWAIYAVSVLAVAFVGAKIIPFLKEKGFYAFTSQMVKAAVTYFVDGQGREKFDWVFEQVNAKYGEWFDVDIIKNAIQSAYVDMCIALGKE